MPLRFWVLLSILLLSPSRLTAQRLGRDFPRGSLDMSPSPRSHDLARSFQNAARPKLGWYVLGGAAVGGILGAFFLGPKLMKAEVGPQGFAYGVGAGLGAVLGGAMGLVVYSFRYPPEPSSPK